jgi:hypothetical protein
MSNTQINGELMASSLKEEVKALEQHLRKLAAHTDDELAARYLIKRSPRPKGLYWQLRGIVGSVLRWFQAWWPWRQKPWPVSLKQLPIDPKAKPLIIWAVGSDRNTLREACTGLSKQWNSMPGYAPVLITDIADFAFFSRLGAWKSIVSRHSGEGFGPSAEAPDGHKNTDSGSALQPPFGRLEPVKVDQPLHVGLKHFT